MNLHNLYHNPILFWVSPDGLHAGCLVPGNTPTDHHGCAVIGAIYCECYDCGHSPEGRWRHYIDAELHDGLYICKACTEHNHPRHP